MAKRVRSGMGAECHALPILGSDDRWYRVCVTCDAIIPQGGTLPRWLRDGYATERDAAMGARDHVRQMMRNRAAIRRHQEWRAEIGAAVRAQDWERFLAAVDANPWGDTFSRLRLRTDITHEEIMAHWAS